MAGLQQTPEEYYNDENLHGNYQYETLSDIINTFLVRYVGDNEELNNVARHRVIFEAKRGLKELTYDALKEIKIIELELDPDNLEITLPHDYVNYVRVSWVDNIGRFHPILESKDTGIVNAYLQDNEYNILFDDEGYPLEGTSTTELNSENIDQQYVTQYNLFGEPSEFDGFGERQSADYGQDTSRANINGTFSISKRGGKMRFSSDIPSRTIVLEYVSDGLEYADPSDIKVHKFAERALYAFIKYEILNNRLDTTEYRIRRAKKDWLKERQNARIRLSNFKPHQLIQRLKGRNKWLK